MRPFRSASGRWAEFSQGPPNIHPNKDRLSDLIAFGSNPGNLRARVYLPSGLRAGAPLVVVLHGCTQTAADYDHGSGWSSLADQEGFALLFPEQQRPNNPNLCFNWFIPTHCRRGEGEPLSIRQMIERMVVDHALGRDRIFITGLSAGGAMTSVMLATYPDVFAGGAIIAGLPYGCAATMPEAFEQMRGGRGPALPDVKHLVRRASSHTGPWPTISIWHGSADQTVVPANSEAILRQWLVLHGLAETPTFAEAVAGYPRRVWCDSEGRELIEMYSITGMGHGTPLATRGDHACGNSGAFMLDANISSTWHISRFWGVTAPAVGRMGAEQPEQRATPSSWARAVSGTQRVIEDALRAAGLMR